MHDNLSQEKEDLALTERMSENMILKETEGQHRDQTAKNLYNIPRSNILS